VYFPIPIPITEDALVLLRTAAPSDCLPFVRLINLHLHYIYITAPSTTEAFLLPALGCGTPCHHICDGTWACTERTCVLAI